MLKENKRTKKGLITVKCNTCDTEVKFLFKEHYKVILLINEMKKHMDHMITIDGDIIMTYPLDRPMFIWMDNMGYITKAGLVGAEIGVDDGFNARKILCNFDIRMLYLIDPYDAYVEDGIEMNHKNKEEVMKKVLSPFKNHIKFIKSTSVDAVKQIPDNSLDFVYIDGNHQYEFVKKDLELYYPKVKSGSIIGGHDFTPETLGVVRAVIEFTDKHKISNIMAKKHSTERDWWFIKP